MFDWFWEEYLWFPANLKVGWKDLENKPGSDIYYPQLRDLHWALALGAVFLVVRFLVSRFIFVPLGYYIGVPKKKTHVIATVPALENAYRQKKALTGANVEILSKTTDMSERQIQVWFRKRKQNDSTKPINKFAECGWHCLFYSSAAIGGFIVLWDTPWFADTLNNWKGWPFQSVSNSIYWYYMLETAFYWGLIFSLCYDHQRKDFKEMILHHVATLFLIYFSWMMNFVRAGSLVLLVHDVADPFLALAKMMSYSKHGDAMSTRFFAIFLVVWTVSRLYYYPFVCLYSTTIEPYSVIDKTFFAHWFFNILLSRLMVLSLMWSYSIASCLYSTTIEPYSVIDKTFFAHWFFNILLYGLMVLSLMWSYSIASCLYSTTIEPYSVIDKTFFAHWFFNILLYGLMVLSLMWSYSIARSAINRLTAGEMKDVRSDSECSDNKDNNTSRSSQNGSKSSRNGSKSSQNGSKSSRNGNSSLNTNNNVK